MLRTHLGLKIALRNKSESLDIQREKLSALPPALLPLNTAALRFEFQQWKKSWKLQSKSADGIQMLIHILFEFAAIYNFYFERKTVTHLLNTDLHCSNVCFFMRLFVCVTKKLVTIFGIGGCAHDLVFTFSHQYCCTAWIHTPKKFSLTETRQKSARCK